MHDDLPLKPMANKRCSINAAWRLEYMYILSTLPTIVIYVCVVNIEVGILLITLLF